MNFFKAIRLDELKQDLIPGTVTNCFDEALLWLNRYNSKKKNGITRHIRTGKAVIIEFEFDENILKAPCNFQVKGISEHNKETCWTSILKQKAQINIIVKNWKIIEGY